MWLAHSFIESENANGIALVVGKVREARGQHLRVVALLHFAGSIVHGSAHIEQDQDARVRFAFEELDEKLVAAAVDIPVDAPDFITRLILAVLCEIDAEPR